MVDVLTVCVESCSDIKKTEYSYSEQRELLDVESINVSRIRVKRSVNNNHYIPQMGLRTEQKWDYIELEPTMITDTRTQFKEDFENCYIDLGVANELLDQEGEGSCSFVGFLNCCILSGKKNKVKKTASQRNWKKQWGKIQHHLNTTYGSPDIAATLDAMKKVKILDDSGLIYVPIRSSGAREENFNTRFWKKHMDKKINILEKYDITNTNYLAAPFIYQNMFLLESLIDQNIPVAVNALGHTRTLIGYNDDKFIFADNWGYSSKSINVNVNSHYSKLEDNFIAGYSTVKKWAIATNVRDIAYWV